MATTNKKLTKLMVQPINQIFNHLKNKDKVQIWLYEEKDLRLEGRILGFDEYMNVVLDEAEEVSVKKKTRRSVGKLLLKGDSITLILNTGN